MWVTNEEKKKKGREQVIVGAAHLFTLNYSKAYFGLTKEGVSPKFCRFFIKNFCLTVLKISLVGPFIFLKLSVIENFYATEGDQVFSSELLSHSTKNICKGAFGVFGNFRVFVSECFGML